MLHEINLINDRNQILNDMINKHQIVNDDNQINMLNEKHLIVVNDNQFTGNLIKIDNLLNNNIDIKLQNLKIDMIKMLNQKLMINNLKNLEIIKLMNSTHFNTKKT